MMSEEKPIPIGNFSLSGSIPKLTRLAYNTSVRNSLKVTIPMEIVKRLKLKKGDDVVWFIGQVQEGSLIALLYNKEDYQMVIKQSNTQTFFEFVREFDPVTQEVLRILISSNAAMSVQTIRNAYVQHQTTQNASKLQALAEHLIQQTSETDITPIKLTESQFRILMELLKKAQPMSTKEIEREVHTAYLMENATQIDKIRKLAKNEQERIKAVAELNKKFDLNIPSYRKIESELYRLKERGLVEFAEYRTPQAKTKANRYWSLDTIFYERWVQRKGLVTKDIQIPARQTIGSILQTLAQAGIVKITIPSGKKADAFYFISSRVYDVWYMQREQLKDKTNKTDAEKFWFE